MEVKRIMRPYRGNRSRGFTIIEVMIAMVIASAVVTAVYQTFIGKYLSSLCKPDHIIAPKEWFESQL
jgi:prepilin-type N-terminal cleavage/methylation domain-containing protein